MIFQARQGLSIAPRWVELVLVVALAWVVSTWWVSTEPSNFQSVEGGLIQSKEGSLFDTTMLSDVSLFGKQEKAQAVIKKEVLRPVVVSRLNIKLLGTVVANEHSAAIVLLNGGGEQQVFFLGDTIQSGVSLTKVEVDAIVVEHQGKPERIVMSKSKLLVEGEASSVPALVSSSREQRVSRLYLNQQVRNFPKLLSQARVVPHFNQGKSDGFVISNIVPNSLYQTIGLKNGDIIRKVNGQPVTSAEQAMKMYQALQSATAIDLELQRDGVIMPIHYVLQ